MQRGVSSKLVVTVLEVVTFVAVKHFSQRSAILHIAVGLVQFYTGVLISP